MKALIPALLLTLNLGAGAASAQPYTPNAAGTMGHWHLNSSDPGRQEDLRRHGRRRHQQGRLQRVIFPGVLMNINLGGAARRRRPAARSDRWSITSASS